MQVAKTLGFVLRNALVSVTFAWCIMLCFSLGNIFSGQSAANQSRQSFGVSVLLWSKFFSWMCVSINQTVPLLKYRFACAPDRKPHFLLCWKKMVKGTLISFIMSSAIPLAIAIGLESGAVGDYKLDLYIGGLFCHADSACCAVVGRRLYREETVEGRLKWKDKRQAPFAAQFVRTFCETIASISFCVIAALYAHGAKYMKLTTQMDVVLFTLGSFVIKLSMQEFAKHIVFKKQILHVGAMAATVGIPTILIDTQMRVAMLRTQSASMSLLGAFAMTFVEITLRLFKAHLTKVQIRNRTTINSDGLLSRTFSRSSNVSIFLTPFRRKSSVFGVAIQPKLDERGTTALERWRMQALLYHAAEVYVDMFAEYVALGCSYAILFLCWNHPKYKPGQPDPSVSGSTGGGTGVALATRPQVLLLGVQLGLEVVVDYVSCLLETKHGINLQPLHRHGLFLAVFLVWAAVGNIFISASLFIRDED